MGVRVLMLEHYSTALAGLGRRAELCVGVTLPELRKGAKGEIKRPGPSGLQLEVRAQRAPTLLSVDILLCVALSLKKN